MERALFDIPNIAFFQNKNVYSGSRLELNYRLIPDGDQLRTEIWYGKLCSLLSEMEEIKDFPLTAEGLEEAIAWLNSLPPEK